MNDARLLTEFRDLQAREFKFVVTAISEGSGGASAPTATALRGVRWLKTLTELESYIA